MFGADAPYLKSLVTTYIAYSLSIALSSVLSDVCDSLLGLSESVTWLVTLGVTSVINFYTVRKAMVVKEEERGNKSD